MKHEVVIVGGGIVGLSSAYELASRGFDVVVIDRGDVGAGCAEGSAGHIVPSHVIPLAAPGAARHAIESLLDREGPLSVRWGMGPRLWRWLVAFARSCRQADLDAAAGALSDLGTLSVALIDAWIDGLDIPCYRRTDGLLDVYGDQASFEVAASSAELASLHGVAVEILDGATARSLEPALKTSVIGAVRFPHDGNLDPAKFLDGLRRATLAAGATLLSGVEMRGLTSSGRSITKVDTDHGPIGAGHVVIAAGAWSGGLASTLGEKIPVVSGRGFSLTADRPAVGPRCAMLLGEKHVAVGPMGDKLRLSGRFEVGEYGSTPDPRRIAQIERLARTRLDFDDPLIIRETWAGLRPITPDGVPIVSASSRWDNVTIATGHAMIGLSIGPGSGRLVAQLVAGEPTEIDSTPFSLARFQ
jgi:D-amino-acid dehydrogenase